MKRVFTILVFFALLPTLLACRSALAVTFTELEAKFSANSPTIDGFLGGAEWNDTTKKAISLTGASDIEAWLYIKHNGTHIHVGLVVWIIGIHGTDEFIVAFDEGNDGGRGSGSRDYALTPLQEDLKSCYSSDQIRDGYYNGSWYSVSGDVDFVADCARENDHGTSASEIEYWEGLGWVDDHWECEFSIPFVGNDAGVTDISDLVCSLTDIIGFKIQYFYTGANNFYYPAGDKTQVNTFANLSFPPPTIESCSATGGQQDSFNLYEDVRVNGSGYLNAADYKIYVVSDVETWTDGMRIPARIPGTAMMISSDSNGIVSPFTVWNDPSNVGKYDILVDVDDNGEYNEGIDALDSGDVEVTAGFVVPELSSFVALMTFMLAAFIALFASRKRPI